MSNLLYFIHCVSPVHVGAGQGVGIIDLPLMRERVTSWPYIPGSSIKGVLRHYCRQLGETQYSKSQEILAFGKDPDDNNHKSDAAGLLAFTDSRLFAFPVASRFGTFAYVSCPLAIKRLLRDAEAVNVPIEGLNPGMLEAIEQGIKENESSAFVGGIGASKVVHAEKSDKNDKSDVINKNNKNDKTFKIYIDEFEFDAYENAELGRWIEALSVVIFENPISRKMFRERFIVVSDEAFQYFAEMCCEVVTRVKIGETGVVERGLWSEEYLPSESILYGFIGVDAFRRPGQGDDSWLKPILQPLQLQMGGNATVGQGRVNWVVRRANA
jgi:CRISPR-associated protein Cmr4